MSVMGAGTPPRAPRSGRLRAHLLGTAEGEVDEEQPHLQPLPGDQVRVTLDRSGWAVLSQSHRIKLADGNRTIISQIIPLCLKKLLIETIH